MFVTALTDLLDPFVPPEEALAPLGSLYTFVHVGMVLALVLAIFSTGWCGEQVVKQERDMENAGPLGCCCAWTVWCLGRSAPL